MDMKENWSAVRVLKSLLLMDTKATDSDFKDYRDEHDFFFLFFFFAAVQEECDPPLMLNGHCCFLTQLHTELELNSVYVPVSMAKKKWPVILLLRHVKTRFL